MLTKSWCVLGYGLFAREEINKGDFLLEYRGELIDIDEAEKREKEYIDRRLGSFMYFFSHGGKQLW